MPRQKALRGMLAEDGGGAREHLGFGAAGIGEQSFRGKRGAEAGEQIENRAHGRCQNNNLAATDCVGWIGVAVVDGAFGACPLQHRRPVAADDAPNEAIRLERQPQRPANQPGPDDRDLANGHLDISVKRE